MTDYLDAIVNSVPLEDVIEKNTTEKLIYMKEVRDQINLVLSVLKERDRAVIEHRFGLNGKTEKTLRECCKIFGISTARISQLEQRGLRKLRRRLHAEKIIDYFDLLFH